MSLRAEPYRNKCPDAVKERIAQLSSRTMYLIQNPGPTSYIIREDGSEKKERVLIGSRQSCTCADAEICLHILYVMIKVLRVPPTNPIVWQRSLTDGETDQVLKIQREQQQRRETHTQNFLRRRSRAIRVNSNGEVVTGAGEDPAAASAALHSFLPDVERQSATQDDICSICQEPLLPPSLSSQPTEEGEEGNVALKSALDSLIWCRKSCGNNFHIKCMKMYAEHCKSSSGKSPVSCPLCRQDWGPMALHDLRTAEINARPTQIHKGVTCYQCRIPTINGKRFRCLSCGPSGSGTGSVPAVDLCQRCFERDSHSQHPFVMKTFTSEDWAPAHRPKDRPGLSNQTLLELQGRELTTNDYDVLLRLDEAENLTLKEHLLGCLPAITICSSSEKCSLCQEALNPSSDMKAKRLPCKHTFHEACLLERIIERKYTCPLDECCRTIFPGLAPKPAQPSVSAAGTNNQDHKQSSKALGRKPLSRSHVRPETAKQDRDGVTEHHESTLFPLLQGRSMSNDNALASARSSSSTVASSVAPSSRNLRQKLRPAVSSHCRKRPEVLGGELESLSLSSLLQVQHTGPLEGGLSRYIGTEGLETEVDRPEVEEEGLEDRSTSLPSLLTRPLGGSSEILSSCAPTCTEDTSEGIHVLKKNSRLPPLPSSRSRGEEEEDGISGQPPPLAASSAKDTELRLAQSEARRQEHHTKAQESRKRQKEEREKQRLARLQQTKEREVSLKAMLTAGDPREEVEDEREENHPKESNAKRERLEQLVQAKKEKREEKERQRKERVAEEKRRESLLLAQNLQHQKEKEAALEDVRQEKAMSSTSRPPTRQAIFAKQQMKKQELLAIARRDRDRDKLLGNNATGHEGRAQRLPLMSNLSGNQEM